MPDRHPTTRRLIAEGLRLFAARGMAGTPIVKIEEAAGLAPGSGAFYRHFRSKDALLEAAIDDAAEVMRSNDELLVTLADRPVEEQALLFVRGSFMYYDTQRDLALVLIRDAGQRPPNYSYEPGRWPGAGMKAMGAWLASLVAKGELEIDDPDATAVLLMDSIIQYWLQRVVDDPVPYGIDEERFIAAWTAALLRYRPGAR